MKKKRATRASVPGGKAPAQSLASLKHRVAALEKDFHSLRSDMGLLSDEVASLKVVVKQVDARTLRGEKLMLDMQGEQMRVSRTVDRIAQHFSLAPEPRKSALADPGDSSPPDADEPE